MPWPMIMALHMLDINTMRPISWPWPKRSWRFNKLALDAMQAVAYADQMMKKQPTLWDANEDKFFEDVTEASAEVDNYVNIVDLQPSHHN